MHVVFVSIYARKIYLSMTWSVHFPQIPCICTYDKFHSLPMNVDSRKGPGWPVWNIFNDLFENSNHLYIGNINRPCIRMFILSLLHDVIQVTRESKHNYRWRYSANEVKFIQVFSTWVLLKISFSIIISQNHSSIMIFAFNMVDKPIHNTVDSR